MCGRQWTAEGHGGSYDSSEILVPRDKVTCMHMTFLQDYGLIYTDENPGKLD